MELNINLLNEYYMQYQSNVSKYQKMKDYYDGKHDVEITYNKMNDRGNFISERNFIAKFVNDETNFVVGIPINYISRENNADVIKDIEYNLADWDKMHNINLGNSLGSMSEATELYYINSKGKFSCTILSPLNSYIVKNELGDIECLLHVFKRGIGNTTKDTNTYIDVYTKDYIYHYKNTLTNRNTGFKVKSYVFNEYTEISTPTPNIFNEIPIGNGILPKTIYDKIKNSQDEFNICNSEQINLIQDLRQFYLVFTDLDGENPEIQNMIKKINTNSVMMLKGGADAKTLNKDVNDQFMQNVRNNIKDDMYELVGHINMQKSPTSNSSGDQIINRMIQLKFRCAEISAILQNIIRERLKFLFIYLKIKENKNYDYNDLAVKITYNIPKDWTVMSNVVSQIAGKDILSKDTMRGILPLDYSPEIEKQKIQREKEEERAMEEKLNLESYSDTNSKENGVINE